MPQFRPLELPPSIAGSVLLSGMPGRFEPWADFEAKARDAGLQLVVSLAPLEELEQVSPAYHRAVLQGALPFRWMSLPMRNFGLPEDPPAFRRGVQQIAEALRRGDVVLLHCAAGLGRTGSAAACVLKTLGFDAAEALQRVRAAGSNPQNASQSGFVHWF